MDDMKSGSIHFKNALEVAAYVVCLEQMGNTTNYNIKQVIDGYELVLEKPISMIKHLGIIGGIAADQKSNPQKWISTKAEIENKL